MESAFEVQFQVTAVIDREDDAQQVADEIGMVQYVAASQRLPPLYAPSATTVHAWNKPTTGALCGVDNARDIVGHQSNDVNCAECLKLIPSATGHTFEVWRSSFVSTGENLPETTQEIAEAAWNAAKGVSQ